MASSDPNAAGLENLVSSQKDAKMLVEGAVNFWEQPPMLSSYSSVREDKVRFNWVS